MAKERESKTTTVTTTTQVTTTTTEVTTETKTEETIKAPCYMPIDPEDIGAEKYYKEHGIPVREIERFGVVRKCAIIQNPNYDENSSEEEKKAAEEEADQFSRKISNYRRNKQYHDKKIKEHENVSLTGMMDAGFDPSSNNLDIAIKISAKISDSVVEDDDPSVDDDADDTEEIDTTEYDDDDEYSRNESVSRGGYDSSTDINSPEYIVLKKLLMEKLRDLIDDMDAEELAIANMIMHEKSEREYCKKNKIPRSTLQGHKEKLLARLRKELKDYYR